MKKSEVNEWLGVITNFGLIAGLVLVAYEINQNNITLEREARISQVEVTDGIRAAWQNWEYVIIENRDVADIWMRGNAGDHLEPLETFRYEQLAKAMFRLFAQTYLQYSTIAGEPHDRTVEQLIGSSDGILRLRTVFIHQLDQMTPSSDYYAFKTRIGEIDPPELRRQNSEN